MGTENWGLPRIGIESFGDSHGSTFGCSLKSVNQEHAVSAIVSASAPPRRSRIARSALIANLHRPVLAQHVGCLAGPIGARGHPDAEVTVAESAVVADGERQPRQARDGEHAEYGRERTDEHHQLEADDRVG